MIGQIIHSKRLRITLFLLLIGVIVGGATLIPCTPQLLDCAHRIGGLAPADSRFTLTDHTILLVRSTQRPRGPDGDMDEDFYIQDFAAGTVTLQPKLTRWYNAQWRPFNFAITPSPDGKWILCWQDTAALVGGGVISTDGQKHQEITLDSATSREPCWSSDSQYVYTFPTSNSGRLADRALRYSVDATQDRPPQECSFVPPPDATTDDNPCLDCLVDAKSEIRTVTSHGDRVVWISYAKAHSPLRAWLHRFFPKVDDGTQLYASFWVGNKNGIHSHEIGAVAIDLKLSQSPTPIFEQLRWMPDGSHLTFIFRDALWIVSLDG